MTIIAITLFMVPFTGLCIFILLWGISDLRKRKRETPGDAAVKQTPDR
ncbi:MAG: hypothetical protein ABIP14_08210 [Blastocatellia bacterium]